MLIKAASKYIRQSPRKVRLVVDLVRSLKPEEALKILKNLPQRAAQPVYKTLKQAVANAVNNHNLAKDKLLIQSIEVNQGPTYKRWRAVSRGRAHPIQKKTSHIKIILKGENGSKSKS
jgi:large subunit ribosomal protein L22